MISGQGADGTDVVAAPLHKRGGRLRPKYLLRISHAVASPGAKSGVHTHPRTEAWLVLKGQLSQQTPQGVNVVEAGKTLAGGPPSIRWRSPTAAEKNCIG